MLAAPLASAQAAERPQVLAESFSRPLDAGWKQGGSLVHRNGRGGASLRLSRPKGKGRRPQLAHALPPRPWAVSIDVRLGSGGAAVLGLGSKGRRLRIKQGRARTLVLEVGRWRKSVRPRKGWATGGWRHLEITGGPKVRVAVDGQKLAPPIAAGASLGVAVDRGRLELAGLVASRGDDRRALLLHRLAELHARTPLGRFPLGTGMKDRRLRFAGGWTTGFWPGSLWQAADLTPGSDLFRGWALAATLAHFGHERDDSHDLGFMYGHSSLAAYRRLCSTPSGGGDAALCQRLRDSALSAAEGLLALARTNEAAGTIPTRSQTLCTGCGSLGEADTIIDSMMNLSLLIWASEQTGNGSYRDLAVRHARVVQRLLVRPDGSTIQSVHNRRSDGSVVRAHTHQGLSDASTWSRGQAWALYGFAEVAALLGDRELLATSERTARYVASRLPPGGVPPWDYDARPGAQIDVSAGAITAAGLFRLADACERITPACENTGGWRALGDRMLGAALARSSSRPPLGFLGDQVYSLGGSGSWDDRAELIFGLDYALEGVNLSAR